MGNFTNELHNYKNVPRELVFDKTLSDRARFVYVFMACKPDGWDFYITPMAKEIGYSVDTLRKYLNELVASGWLVKGEQSNEHGNFGAVEYTLKATKFTDTEKFRHGKNATQDNKDNKENYLNNINNKKEENKENKKERKRNVIQYTPEFEKAFVATGRKGSKKNAFKRWLTLSDEDKEKVFAHIPFYYKSNDRQFLKDFEGYLNGRYFENVVYDKKGNITYDPDRENGNIPYTPSCGGNLNWNDFYNCYLYVGMWFGSVADGYTDDNRPDGATIRLNNAQGTAKWNKEKKTWIVTKTYEQ